MSLKARVWRKKVSKLGRVGMSGTIYIENADGTTSVDHTEPIVYCADATTAAEAKLMLANVGKTTFLRPSTTEDGTIINNVSYGTLEMVDTAAESKATTGVSLTDAIKAAYAKAKNAKKALEGAANKR